MINRVVLVGRLTKDPSLTYTPSGIAMCRFTVAVNRTYKQEGQPEADFIGCLAWRKQAENLANFMKKGSLIGVEGRIQTGSFEGQDGKRVYTTDVVVESVQFLEPRSSSSDSSNSAPNYQSNTNNQSQPQSQNTGQYGGQNQPSGNTGQFNSNADPFANGNVPPVSEDDLPFDNRQVR